MGRKPSEEEKLSYLFCFKLGDLRSQDLLFVGLRTQEVDILRCSEEDTNKSRKNFQMFLCYSDKLDFSFPKLFIL